jgi:hypothetical protein
MTLETIIAITPAVLALGAYLGTGIVEEIHSLRAIAEARRIIAVRSAALEMVTLGSLDNYLALADPFRNAKPCWQ